MFIVRSQTCRITWCCCMPIREVLNDAPCDAVMVRLGSSNVVLLNHQPVTSGRWCYAPQGHTATTVTVTCSASLRGFEWKAWSSACWQNFVNQTDKPWLGSGQELGITFIGPLSGVMAAAGLQNSIFPRLLQGFFHKYQVWSQWFFNVFLAVAHGLIVSVLFNFPKKSRFGKCECPKNLPGWKIFT